MKPYGVVELKNQAVSDIVCEWCKCLWTRSGETFRARKPMAKSRILALRSCFIHIIIPRDYQGNLLHILKNRGSIHTRTFRPIHFSAFKYRWTKNGFTGPKSFRGFRETGPRSTKKRFRIRSWQNQQQVCTKNLKKLAYTCLWASFIATCQEFLTSVYEFFRVLNNKRKNMFSSLWTIRDSVRVFKRCFM